MKNAAINTIRLLLSGLYLSVVLSPTISIAAPGAHGPNGEHLTEESSHNSSSTFGRQADGSVMMPMAMQATLNIQTLFAESGSAQQTVSFPGAIRPHNRGHAIVQPGNNGHYFSTDSGTPLSGTLVNEGDVLGYIQYSDTAFELASQNSELLSVRNDIAQTRRDVQRLEELGELASEQQLEQLQTRLKTLTEQEVALQAGVEKPIPLVARQNGVLLNHQVTNGKWVQAGTVLFEIVAPQFRQIEVHTNQFDISHQIQSASIQELPGTELNYLGYSPTLKNGQMALFFEYDSSGADANSQPALPVNQHVTVLVQKNEDVQGIVLPGSALVSNSNNLPVVWIKVSAERFLPQIVEYQAIAHDKVIVTSGLGDENRVVVRGTSLLNQVR